MPRGHLALHVIQADARLDHQHHDVIHQVADLVDRVRAVAILRGDDDLRRLLADLLEDLVQALFKQIRRIGAFLRILLSPAEHVHQVLILEGGGLVALEDHVAEAGLRAQMAGRAVLAHLDEQRVAVTVRGDGDDMLEVAARLALRPELPAGAGVKAGQALLHRQAQALLVHVSDHQHAPGLGVDDDGGDQPAVVIFEPGHIKTNLTHAVPSVR